MSDNLDKVDGFVLVTLGGQERKMRFSLHAAAQLQKVLGKNPMKSVSVTPEQYENLTDEERLKIDNDPNRIDQQDPEELSAFVWCLLITDNEDLDGYITKDGVLDKEARNGLRQVSKWLDFETLERIIPLITEVMNVASPPNDEKEKKDNTPKK